MHSNEAGSVEVDDRADAPIEMQPALELNGARARATDGLLA